MRMGVHAGVCEERDGEDFGPVVNRAARLEAVAHGGQVLVSGAAGRCAPGRGGTSGPGAAPAEGPGSSRADLPVRWRSSSLVSDEE